MIKHFQYITAPPLPFEIKTDAIKQICLDNQLKFKQESNIGQLFKMYHIKSGITKDFLIDTFGSNFFFRIQTQLAGYQPPHIDPSRTFAINYYLDLGGVASFTHFYKSCNDLDPIESHHIQAERWCKLDVTTPHNVIGITGIRIAITVCDG